MSQAVYFYKVMMLIHSYKACVHKSTTQKFWFLDDFFSSFFEELSVILVYCWQKNQTNKKNKHKTKKQPAILGRFQRLE